MGKQHSKFDGKSHVDVPMMSLMAKVNRVCCVCQDHQSSLLLEDNLEDDQLGSSDDGSTRQMGLFNIPIEALLTPEQNHQLMQLISTKLSDPNSSACSYVTDTTDNNHLSANENIARSRSSCMSENNKRFINNCMSQNNRRFESRNVQGSEKTENIQKTDYQLTEEPNVRSSSDRQWSFTLYDFEGHGKVTKEAFSRLLESLYDSVESTLPEDGANMMKLHLTVSPISQNQNSQSVSTEVAKKNLPGCIIVRKETIASSLPVDSIRQIPVMSNSRTSVVQKNHSPVKISENKCIDQHVKQSHAKQSPVEKSHIKQPNVKQSNVEAVVSSADKTTKVNGGQSFRVFEPTNARCRTVSSKRLSHNDEKKLAKLIQRSFDLNKPTRPHKHKYQKQTNQMFVNNSHVSHSNKPLVETETVDCLNSRLQNEGADSIERRTYYLNLVGTESSIRHGPGGNAVNRIADPPVCNSTSNVKRSLHDNNRRDKICENNCDATSKNISIDAKHEKPRGRVKSSKGDNSATANVSLDPKKSNFPEDLEKISLTHYHHRHRQREKNFDRAMRQVAEWIEQEHATRDIPDRVVERSRPGENVLFVQHDHHHIHEHHHHHHYHH